MGGGERRGISAFVEVALVFVVLVHAEQAHHLEQSDEDHTEERPVLLVGARWTAYSFSEERDGAIGVDYQNGCEHVHTDISSDHEYIWRIMATAYQMILVGICGNVERVVAGHGEARGRVK